MNSDGEYGARLQSLLDSIIASGADKILADGDELVMDIDNESVIITRIKGRLSLRIVQRYPSSALE